MVNRTKTPIIFCVALTIAALLSWTAPSAALGEPSPTGTSASVQPGVASARFQLQVPVLYYHHVLCAPADALDPTLYICPEQFDAQMSYLHDQGWSTITADQLADLMANRQCPPARTFVVSFDDGPEDAYTNAAPILERYGMHGTFFVTSGVEGGAREGRITWDQMTDLVARGHAIGDHTETHLNLKKQTADVLYQQIEGAQQIFAEHLGFRPRTFAYPYGRYNDAAIAQVASSGFELAFTVSGGAKEASDAPYVSKRIQVLASASPAEVLAKVAPFVEGCRPPTPDLSVATVQAGPYKGDNIHSLKGTQQQTVKISGARVGQTYRYWVRLDNDAQSAGSFAVVPSVDGTATMDIRYKINGVDVTGTMASGTYVTSSIEPWGSTTVVVLITPRKPKVAGAFTTVVVRTSSPDSGSVDVVRMTTAF